MLCTFRPYEGSEPFAFISYSHDDSDRIFPILNNLNISGYRIWYDEGVEWGSEWPESIAIHLAKCDVCIAFHSASSIESVNCRQEIYFALKMRRKILSVFLDEISLPSGLDLQLSPLQSVKYYAFSSIGKFITEMQERDILVGCKRGDVAIDESDIDSDERDNAYNFDKELLNVYEDLFGSKRKDDQAKVLSPLQKKAEEIRVRNFMKRFVEMNCKANSSTQNDTPQNRSDKRCSGESCQLSENLDKENGNHTFRQRNSLQGKYFTLTEPPEQKTLVYEVYVCYSYEKLAKYYDAEVLQYREIELENSFVRRTYYIEDPQEDGNRLILLTFCEKEVLINNGILLGDEVRINETPHLFKYNDIQPDDNHNLSCSAYNLVDLGEELKKELNGELDGKWVDADIYYPSVIIIDSKDATPVKRELFKDEESGKLKARIFIIPNRSYFTMCLRNFDDNSIYTPLSDFEIGMNYAYGGRGFPVDVIKALEYLEKCNSADALFEISQIFMCFDDYLDKELGIKYLQLSAEQGHIDAQNKLGVCYEDGDGVEWDVFKAVKWYSMAANKGDATAQFNLGTCFQNGIGVEKDSYEAVKWFRKASEQGYKDATLSLYSCYKNGDGVEKDELKAISLYRLAAEQGDAVAQFNLGVSYETGDGVNQDFDKAEMWYQAAAYQDIDYFIQRTEAGASPLAQYCLGLCYNNGDGVEQDANEAAKWYLKAAEYGHAKAQNKLGNFYLDGYGVERNNDEAFKMFYHAAQQNYTSAQNNLGYCYEYGLGVEKNGHEAVKWYRMAADNGSVAAQTHLGNCYKSGFGVKNNADEAVKWYRMAANNGSVAAQNYLGDCYKIGFGVKLDKVKAAKIYQMAAEGGNIKAQKNLGDCYYYGEGVSKDMVLALKWYRKAAEQGNQDAKDAISNGSFSDS